MAGTQTVIVTRTLLSAPDLTDPNRKIYQITYRAGELPPHFIYLAQSDWSEAKEAAAIKADIDKRMTAPQHTITI